LELSRKATSVMRQNLVISLGVSGVLIIAAIFGLTQISHAVVLHEGSTLLVVANGLRLLGFRPQTPAASPEATVGAQPVAS
jgi:Cd2+/Zn2+-exporting ATPase